MLAEYNIVPVVAPANVQRDAIIQHDAFSPDMALARGPQVGVEGQTADHVITAEWSQMSGMPRHRLNDITCEYMAACWTVHCSPESTVRGAPQSPGSGVIRHSAS